MTFHPRTLLPHPIERQTLVPNSTVTDRMQTVFRNVFNEPGLRLGDDLTAADVPGWDSLAHIGLMFSLESEFGITFSDQEMSQLDNVGQLRRIIETKLPAQDSRDRAALPPTT